MSRNSKIYTCSTAAGCCNDNVLWWRRPVWPVFSLSCHGILCSIFYLSTNSHSLASVVRSVLFHPLYIMPQLFWLGEGFVFLFTLCKLIHVDFSPAQLNRTFICNLKYSLPRCQRLRRWPLIVMLAQWAGRLCEILAQNIGNILIWVSTEMVKTTN